MTEHWTTEDLAAWKDNPTARPQQLPRTSFEVSAPEALRVKAKARQPERGEMNKTEARYSQHLALRQAAGEILSWSFEPITLRLAKRTTYTPDFFVVMANCEIQLHEVKGSWRAPHQEDARVKIKVAAELFPWARFVSASVDGKSWKFEEF